VWANSNTVSLQLYGMVFSLEGLVFTLCAVAKFAASSRMPSMEELQAQKSSVQLRSCRVYCAHLSSFAPPMPQHLLHGLVTLPTFIYCALWGAYSHGDQFGKELLSKGLLPQWVSENA
jgi:hypothetical protein